MPVTPSRRTLLILAAYVAAAACWTRFATDVAPGWIAAGLEGRAPRPIEAAARWFAGERQTAGALDQWRASGPAVAGALLIHAALLLAIRRWSRGGGRAVTIASVVLIVASLAFLIATAVNGDVQDYHLYLDIWREVLAGHDPWYLVAGGPTATFSLHAYGPLYNLLALPTLWNPLGPKLLFAAAYWAFVSWLALAAPRQGLPSWWAPALAIWFAGPFAWVEIADFGHFDVLVALSCVAAIETRAQGRWTAAALWTASGTLLKYFPAVLAPFSALDRGKVRWRWLAATAGLSVAGLVLAWAIWGPSVFRPFRLAAGRESAGMSIFRFLSGSHSPIGRDTLVFSPDEMSGPILLLGLYMAWRWCRRSGLEPAAAGVTAIVATLALYKVGFPQYYMVAYLLVPYWFARESATLSRRGWVVVAYLAAFAWISLYDFRMARDVPPSILIDEWAGLVTFPLMTALAVAIAAVGRKEPSPDVSPSSSSPGPRQG